MSNQRKKELQALENWERSQVYEYWEMVETEAVQAEIAGYQQ